MNRSDQINAPIEAREIIGPNWVGLQTLMSREILRFFKVYMQTIIAPVVTTLLLYTVFLLAFGGIERKIGSIPYMDFLAPGLIMMAMAQNAFANTSSSLIIGKIQGNIVDILMPPLSSFELFFGLWIGGIVRGMTVGLVTTAVVAIFVHIPIHNITALLFFGFIGSAALSALGVMAGIFSEVFDHVAAFANFIITPLTFLSGTFYSVDALPGIWRDLGHANPFFYMIDGFRYGFIGQSDANIFLGGIILSLFVLCIATSSFLMIKAGYKLKS